MQIEKQQHESFKILPGITLSNDARTITLAANAASVSVAPGINMIQICV